MLSGQLAVLQAPMFDGLSLDPFALFEDGAGPAEVGVGGRHVAEALVVTLVVVVLDEGLDLGLEVSGQEVVFQQNAVLEGLVPALDLALGLRVHRGAAHVTHLAGLDVFRQFAGDVTGAVIAEQPRFVQHRGVIASGRGERQVQRVGHILGPHVGAQPLTQRPSATECRDSDGAKAARDAPPLHTPGQCSVPQRWSQRWRQYRAIRPSHQLFLGAIAANQIEWRWNDMVSMIAAAPVGTHGAATRLPRHHGQPEPGGDRYSREQANGCAQREHLLSGTRA